MKLVLLSLILFAGCPPKPPVPTGASCADACRHLSDLGCDEARPTPAGATCEAVCENARSSGIVDLGLACVVAAASCSDARACPRR